MSTEAPPDKNKQEKSRFQDWQAVIEEQKTAYAIQQDQQGTFLQFSRQQEASYWQELLQRDDLTQKERLAIEKAFLAARQGIRQDQIAADVDGYKQQIAAAKNNYDEQLNIARTAAEEMRRVYGEQSAQYRTAANSIVQIEREKQQQLRTLEETRIDGQRQLELAAVDHAEAMAKLEQQAHKVSKDTILRQEMQFEQQRYQIEANALQERLNLAKSDPTSDPVKLAQLNNQIEALTRTHTYKITEMNQAAAQQTGGIWDSLVNGLQGTWEKGLQAMSNGTLTFKNAVAGIFDSVKNIAFSIISSMVTKHLLGEEAKTGATIFGTGIRLAAEVGAAAASIAVWAATAIKNIAISAYTAAAAAYAAIAGIPYVGPFLAPAVAVATLAAVIGFAANIASAEGGYDIPVGINPITQLHEKEMVLPQGPAQVIRDLAEGGPGNGSGGGGAANIHIHAMDSRDVRAFMQDNARHVADAVKTHVRNGGK